MATGRHNTAQAGLLAKQKTWLGYRDNPAPAKVDINVQEQPEEERLARVLELQERLLNAAASSGSGSS